MSYQQFGNQQQPYPASAQPAAMHHQTTTVVAGPQPTPAVVQTKPYNPFAPKAVITKKLGIFILFLGIITFIYGIVMAVVAPEWWASVSGGGIWTGVFVIIVGSLCIGAGSNEDARGVRIGALVMGIFALIFTCSSGILNLIAFIVGINCENSCYWDYYEQRRICDNNCFYNDASAGSIMSLVLMILNLVEFVVILIACIYTGRGCCGGGAQHQPGIIVAPQQAYGAVTVASTHQQGVAPYPQQGAYYPQTSAPGPVYSQQQPAYSQQQPIYSQQPPYSQQQPYAPQQQYTQAPMGAQAGGVTYNSDYGQQSAEEQKVNPDAPPPYSQNA